MVLALSFEAVSGNPVEASIGSLRDWSHLCDTMNTSTMRGPIFRIVSAASTAYPSENLGIRPRRSMVSAGSSSILGPPKELAKSIIGARFDDIDMRQKSESSRRRTTFSHMSRWSDV
ncbi:expressed unknown protein [Seminavis robusta]|uniref:Uncharacterized protein n=1 Tax=Seminavis robusta TaxID=568900 RepID=A0A9N8DD65_9STRA|nr:expressed unknown protein [Seminavis robusta]|eukprot:Sro69_g038540.1 n/a (117) ;mRNA; f:55157-55507